MPASSAPDGVRTPRLWLLTPLKSPDHPVPSGDRTVARLYCAALAAAGFDVRMPSALRLFLGAGGAEGFSAMEAAARAEIARLLALGALEKPALIVTYHNYHRAPDVLGPALAEAFGVPYVIAEATLSPKKAEGPFAQGYAAARAAVRRADLLIVAKPVDRTVLLRERPEPGVLVDLPPFLDANWPAPPVREGRAAQRLLTVAMMRAGDKCASYRLLAEAFGRLQTPGATLTIIGDGEARDDVAALFAPFGARVLFAGAVRERAALAALYAGADLFVWPAVNEAYGMVFLEAAAMGLPALAGDHGGVSAVVEGDRTGVLVAPAPVESFAARFAAATDALLADGARRNALGAAAQSFAREERSLAAAARQLRAWLAPLCAADIEAISGDRRAHSS